MSPNLNYEFSKATVTYACHCAICGVVEQVSWKLFPGYSLPLARLPDGWSKLPVDADRFEFCCPRHSVQILVDGRERYSGKARTETNPHNG